jgi:hypothetical protein
MNDLNNTLAQVNKLIAGEQALKVEATVDAVELAKIGSVIFFSMFLAVVIANLITK